MSTPETRQTSIEEVLNNLSLSHQLADVASHDEKLLAREYEEKYSTLLDRETATQVAKSLHSRGMEIAQLLFSSAKEIQEEEVLILPRFDGEDRVLETESLGRLVVGRITEERYEPDLTYQVSTYTSTGMSSAGEGSLAYITPRDLKVVVRPPIHLGGLHHRVDKLDAIRKAALPEVRRLGVVPDSH